MMFMEKPFPLLVTNLNGLFWFKDFAKNSLNVKKREELLEIQFLRKWRNVVCKELSRLTRWNSLTDWLID